MLEIEFGLIVERENAKTQKVECITIMPLLTVITESEFPYQKFVHLQTIIGNIADSNFYCEGSRCYIGEIN